MRRLISLLTLLVVFILASGALLAQIDENEPEPIDCDQLADLQAELSAQLATFADDLEADAEAAMEVMYNVGLEYQRLALACGYLPPNLGQLVIGASADFARVMTALDELSGDPVHGQLLYNGEELAAGGVTLTCAGCHEGEAPVAPVTEGTWTRWDEQRRLEPAYADESFAYYIAESILHPSEYVPEGYIAGVMPMMYPDQLGYQDLADLIAFLESQDQLMEDTTE